MFTNAYILQENEDDTTGSKADTVLNDSELEDTSEITPPHPRSSTPEQKEKDERPQLAIPTLTFPEEAAENPNLDQLPSPHAFGPPMPLDPLVPTISQKISISTTVMQPEVSSPTSSLPSPSLPSPSLPSPETAKPPLSPESSLLPFPGETSETKQEQDLSKTDETDMDFAASLIPPKLVETRRHSSVELKPDSEGGLLMPTQFPEMKRYTLVDVSPLSELGADNGSTLSDQNKDAFTPLTWKRERKLSSVDGTQSSSSSRSASLAPPAEPRSRRYSTFAEMGIQSYAMAKGERTVNASDVQVKRERRKSRLNFSLSSVNLTTPVAKPEEKADEMGKTTESSTASPEQKNESDKKESAKKKSSGLSVETKAVKKKPSKQRDCIIM